MTESGLANGVRVQRPGQRGHRDQVLGERRLNQLSGRDPQLRVPPCGKHTQKKRHFGYHRQNRAGNRSQPRPGTAAGPRTSRPGRGARVYAAARDPQAVDLAGVTPIALDITDPAQVAAAAQAASGVAILVGDTGIEPVTSSV